MTPSAESLHKINFGAGDGKLDGWINVDLEPADRPEVLADLSRALPFASASVDCIFTEDFIVQLSLDEGYTFLSECRRILKPDGVMRLLTPDLERFARAYLEDPEWLIEIWDRFLAIPLRTRSACELFNIGIRGAGQFHYDRATLRRVAADCGFRAQEVDYNDSTHRALRGLDIRKPDQSISMYFELYPE